MVGAHVSEMYVAYDNPGEILGCCFVISLHSPHPTSPDFESETTFLSPPLPSLSTHLMMSAVFPADLSPSVTTLIIPPSFIVLDASWERSEDGEESGEFVENI